MLEGKTIHSAMDEFRTILEIKQEFVTKQARILSQPLHPSTSWRRVNSVTGEREHSGRLPENIVNEVMISVNNILRQHSHRTNPPQATRHVAEQIDRFYYDAAERPVLQDDSDVLGTDVDYGAYLILPSSIYSERTRATKRKYFQETMPLSQPYPLTGRTSARFGAILWKLKNILRLWPNLFY